jgi:cytoskeletal protein RodZ
MKHKHKKNKRYIHRTIVGVVLILAMVCISIFVIFDNKRQTTTTLPDYSSSNATPKEESRKSEDQYTQTDTSDIEMTISNASQDSTGGPMVIRTIVSSLEPGACTYTLTNDSIAKSFKNTLVNLGTYSGCIIDIQPNEITNGDYSLVIEVLSGSHQGSKTTSLSVSGL